MTSFLAIVKLTCRSAMRSNVCRFLLFLLIVCVILVPNTIKGDGTAYGYIQVMLEYSTGIVALILSTSIIWLSCSEFCTDMENGQIHMIFVKPVSRITVWFGKFTGVFLIHLVLLIIASVFIYAFVIFQYNRQKFTPEERAKMENEVFAGRRSYLPVIKDLNKQVEQVVAERIKKANTLGEKLPDMSGGERRKYLETVKMELLSQMGEVRPGEVQQWYYDTLPKSYDGPVFVRYKIYSGTLFSKDQKMAFGTWLIRYVQIIYDENSTTDPKKIVDRKEYQIQKPPEQIVCGIYNEFPVNGATLIYDGTAYLRFANLGQPGSDTLHFQVTDSPRLLIKQASFLNNYARAVFTTALGIFALGLIACSASAFLSMPTAIFITISYVLTGMFSSYIITSIDSTSEGVDVNFLDAVGTYTGKVMMSLLIPVQSFFVSGSLATGELIEYGFIMQLLVFNIILKGLPLCALGVYLYWRREVAQAMKQ